MKVLITGTSRGIGRACALKFLAEKNEVIGLDVCPDSISGDSSVKNAECYKHFVCDISKENSLPEINGVEILVNNAGIQTASNFSLDDIKVNLIGTIAVTEKYAFQKKIKLSTSWAIAVEIYERDANEKNPSDLKRLPIAQLRRAFTTDDETNATDEPSTTYQEPAKVALSASLTSEFSEA